MSANSDLAKWDLAKWDLRKRDLPTFGAWALGLVAVSLVSGCFAVEAHAPYGPDVTLLPRGVPVEVTRRYQKWYAIWGIFPLSSREPKDVIAEEQLVEVRVYTEDSVEDAISGLFYGFFYPTGIIIPQTVVVEGNRARLTEKGYVETTAKDDPASEPSTESEPPESGVGGS